MQPFRRVGSAPGQPGFVGRQYGTPGLFDIPAATPLPAAQTPQMAPSLLAEQPELAQYAAGGAINDDLLNKAVQAANNRQPKAPDINDIVKMLNQMPAGSVPLGQGGFLAPSSFGGGY